MSVIIIPVSQPTSTKTYAFVGMTSAGRKMTIEVTAGRDLSVDAVLADVSTTFQGQGSLKIRKENDTPLKIAFGVWLVVLIMGGIGCLLVLLAGFPISGYGDDVWRVPAHWPSLFASQTITTALLRLHLVAFPFVLLLGYLASIKHKKNG